MKDLRELTELAVPFFRNAGLIGEELTEKEFDTLSRVVDILREGAQTIKEIVEQSEVYFKDEYTLPVVTEETDKKEGKAETEKVSHFKRPKGPPPNTKST